MAARYPSPGWGWPGARRERQTTLGGCRQGRERGILLTPDMACPEPAALRWGTKPGTAPEGEAAHTSVVVLEEGPGGEAINSNFQACLLPMG